MISAQFFVGYTAGQVESRAGDELLPSAPLYWLGGQVMGGFNICFDPRSAEVYAYCGDLRATTNRLYSWAESFLLQPHEEGAAAVGLRLWPILAKEKLEELKDMIDEEVKEYGKEVLLDSSWVKYRLIEVELLERFLAIL